MVACSSAGTAAVVRFAVLPGGVVSTGETHTLFFTAEMCNATKMPWDYARERQIKRLAGRASYRGFVNGINRRSRKRRWRE